MRCIEILWQHVIAKTILVVPRERFYNLLPNAHKMGIGGSTVSRSPNPSDIVIPQYATTEGHTPTPSHGHTVALPSAVSSTLCLHHAAEEGRVRSRCCSHRDRNHAQAALREVTDQSSLRQRSRQNSVDEEIEEIVANTLDLPSGRTAQLQRMANVQDSYPKSTSQNGSGTLRRHLRTLERTNASDRSTDSDLEIENLISNVDGAINGAGQERKNSMQDDVDFAKFKEVNEKGTTVLRNGRVIHHQESDLLWRLGLISSETYTIKNATRSAPSAGGYLKPPSYDITEEQMMANIEKEYAEYAGAVN